MKYNAVQKNVYESYKKQTYLLTLECYKFN
jgi:hypothetical protein